jgi:transcriptional regulator with XRE-family HTH domain
MTLLVKTEAARVNKNVSEGAFDAPSSACTVWNVPVADRVKELRKTLGFSQEQVAVRSFVDDEDQVRRIEMVKIENGQNQLTSHPKRKALARGLGISHHLLNAYLDEEIDLDELLRRKDLPTPDPPQATTTELDPRYASFLEAERFAQKNGVDRQAIENVRPTALQSEQDPGPDFWWESIKLEERRLRLERKDPVGTAAKKQADAEKSKEQLKKMAPGMKKRKKKADKQG